MPTEREKMLAGERDDPMAPERVRARERARDLCQSRNATREAERVARRRILRDLFGAGGDSVWMMPANPRYPLRGSRGRRVQSTEVADIAQRCSAHRALIAG